jgi:hypothetical protein
VQLLSDKRDRESERVREQQVSAATDLQQVGIAVMEVWQQDLANEHLNGAAGIEEARWIRRRRRVVGPERSEFMTRTSNLSFVTLSGRDNHAVAPARQPRCNRQERVDVATGSPGDYYNLLHCTASFRFASRRAVLMRIETAISLLNGLKAFTS